MLMSQLDTRALGLLLKEPHKLPQKARGVKNISPEGLARAAKKTADDKSYRRLIRQSLRSDLAPMRAKTDLNECRQPYLRWPW
jgi:hypothetical protein